QVSQFTWAGLLLAVVSLILGFKWMLRKKESPSLLSLVVCTVLIAFFSGGVMIHMLVTYS
ncbi:MAG: hypothetical protein VX227_06875, partial [Nitrospinota bacterium]|nr:hypothetical protein [Nitrospinota bacterium]